MISVIIPTYGKPVFLKKCIESVVTQTFQEWELIVVDDNNPNTQERMETESIVHSFIDKGCRIKYIQHERNMNGAVARNTGFAHAKGEYISLLDSDDEYLPDRLQKCFEKLSQAPQHIAAVYTGCEYRRRGRKFASYDNIQSGNFLVRTLACTFGLFTGSNIFVRKRVVEELGGFDPNFLRHQDYEFMVRVFEKYSLIGIPEVLVIKNNENFNLPDVNKQIAIKEQYLKKYKYIIDNLPHSDQDYIYFWKNITIAEGAMAQNELKLANIYYREARKYGRLSMKTWLRRIAYPFYNLVKRG